MSRIFTHVTLYTELITERSPGLTLLPSQARLAAAKPPMGFLNPFLYEHPQAFFDVRNGTNAISRTGSELE